MTTPVTGGASGTGRIRNSSATRLERIRNEPTALVHERNASAFDTAWSASAGDLVPAYLTSRARARGSAADGGSARGQWRDGVWTLEWSRALYLGNPDDKGLREGGAYSFGFAVHDDNVGSRGHYVSWPLTLGFGAPADVQATRLPGAPGPLPPRGAASARRETR